MSNDEKHYHDLLLASQRESVVEWIVQNALVNERNQPIEFSKHFFLYDIYSDWTPIQAIIKAAQIGFSTLAILKTLYACYWKAYNVIYTLPVQDDVYRFVPGKVDQIINANQVIGKQVTTKDNMNQKKVGDNFIYYQGTFTEKEALMLSADLCCFDEEDRSNAKVIEQYESRLQYSTYKGQWHFSNPSMPNVGVHKYWLKSDQKHWFIKCRSCGYQQYLDWDKNVDREQGEYVCQKCHAILTIEDRRIGKWVKKWQDKDVSGYWINQMMAPWISCKELLKAEEKGKQYFYNFCLGLPYAGSDILVDRDLVLRNITTQASSKTDVCIGVDVGITKHVVAGTPYGVFAIFKTDDWEDIERFFLKYDAVMVIDALPDLTVPREWIRKYRGRVFINYFRKDTRRAEPLDFGKDKEYGVVLSDRTRLIQQAIDELVKGNIKFHLKSEELGEFISHWETMYRVQEEDNLHNPVIRWESSNSVDHFVFAFCYYLIASGRALGAEGAIFKASKEVHGREAYFVENNTIPAISIREFVGEQVKKWPYV